MADVAAARKVLEEAQRECFSLPEWAEKEGMTHEEERDIRLFALERVYALIASALEHLQ